MNNCYFKIIKLLIYISTFYSTQLERILHYFVYDQLFFVSEKLRFSQNRPNEYVETKFCSRTQIKHIGHHPKNVDSSVVS